MVFPALSRRSNGLTSITIPTKWQVPQPAPLFPFDRCGESREAAHHPGRSIQTRREWCFSRAACRSSGREPHHCSAPGSCHPAAHEPDNHLQRCGPFDYDPVSRPTRGCRPDAPVPEGHLNDTPAIRNGCARPRRQTDVRRRCDAHSPAIVGLAGGTIPTDRLEKSTVQIAAPIAAPIRGASHNSQS